jgi:hypothetical protein
MMNCADDQDIISIIGRNSHKRKFSVDYKDFIHGFKEESQPLRSADLNLEDKAHDTEESSAADSQRHKSVKINPWTLSDLYDDEDDESQLSTSFGINSSAEPSDTDIRDLQDTGKRYIAPGSGNILDYLSNDMLIRCFEYIALPSELGRVSLVCSLLSDLAENDTLWKLYFGRMILSLPDDSVSSSSTSLLKKKLTSPREPADVPETDPSLTAMDVDTWICSSCSLIQALKTSTVCEFCSTPKPEPTPAPDLENGEHLLHHIPYVIITSASQLSALWTKGRIESEQLSMSRLSQQQQSSSLDSPPIAESSTSRAETTASATSHGKELYFHPSYNELQSRFNDDVRDWYSWPDHVGLPAMQTHQLKPHHLDSIQSLSMLKHRCKIEAVDRSHHQRWEILSAGWEWLSRELRRYLRQLWIDTDRTINSWNELSNSNHQNLQRVIRKLVRGDWSLLYDSIKSEIDLQADAIYRDLSREWSSINSSSNSNSIDARSCLDFADKIIHRCESFLSWSEFIAEHAYELNDHIRVDQDLHPSRSHRFHTRLACHREVDGEEEFPTENSLSVTDLSLLALRNQLWLRRGFLSIFHTIIDCLELSMDTDSSMRDETIAVLLQLHDLFELIVVVADERGSSLLPSQACFQRKCLAKIDAMVSLSQHIRHRSRRMAHSIEDCLVNHASTDVRALMAIFDDQATSSCRVAEHDRSMTSSHSSKIIYRQTLMKRIEGGGG